MIKRRTILRTPAILTLLLTALIVAAVPACAQMKGSADVVKVKPAPAAVVAAADGPVTFAVKLDIERKWHLYAHGDTTFIGVDLLPDEGFPLEDFSAVYPKGHEGEFFGEKVFMLEGKNEIEVSARVPADLTTGTHTLDLKLTVQACDDKTCLAPAYIPVQVKLTVE